MSGRPVFSLLAPNSTISVFQTALLLARAIFPSLTQTEVTGSLFRADVVPDRGLTGAEHQPQCEWFVTAVVVADPQEMANEAAIITCSCVTGTICGVLRSDKKMEF